MTVYVVAGSGPAFQYDERQYTSASIHFTKDFVNYAQHQDIGTFSNTSSSITVDATNGLYAGKLLTVTWASGTNMTDVHINYTDTKVDDITFSNAAWVVLSGIGNKRDISVFAAETDTFDVVQLAMKQGVEFEADGTANRRRLGTMAFYNSMNNVGLRSTVLKNGTRVGWVDIPEGMHTGTSIGSISVKPDADLHTLFDISSIDTTVELSDRSFDVILVDGKEGLFGVDPCLACTNYEKDWDNAIEADMKCTQGFADLKYAAKSSVSSDNLNNERMQIGSTNPVTDTYKQNRWDYQSASQCYKQAADYTTVETDIYRCTRDRATGTCNSSYDGVCEDWGSCFVLPSPSPPTLPPPPSPPTQPPSPPTQPPSPPTNPPSPLLSPLPPTQSPLLPALPALPAPQPPPPQPQMWEGWMWEGCPPDGNFNDLNGFTLGDAIFVAQVWATGVEPTQCNKYDLNGRNGFTLGDAVFVAEVWSKQKVFLWNFPLPPPSPSSPLSPSSPCFPMPPPPPPPLS